MATRYDPDPLLDEIEAARLQIEAPFAGDRQKFAQYYMEYQKQFADRLLTSVRPAVEPAPGGENAGKSAA